MCDLLSQDFIFDNRIVFCHLTVIFKTLKRTINASQTYLLILFVLFSIKTERNPEKISALLNSQNFRSLGKLESVAYVQLRV